MRKINSAIRIAELDSVSDFIIRMYQSEPSLSEDAILKVIMDEIIDLSAKLTTSINAERVVSNLNELNSERNSIIIGLRQLLNGYAVIPTIDKNKAAKQLLEIFNRYKNITYLNLREESSHIESLLEELSSDAAKNAIGLLEGISTQIERLRIAQDKFNQSREDYTISNTNRIESATSLKQKMKTEINTKLIPYLNTVSQLNPTIFSDFVTKLEIEINNVNVIVANRKKREKEAKKQN